MPQISVALCTYNGAKFLREQLDSIAAQTHLPSEVQVGDDGSTDETISIVKAFEARAPFPIHVAVNEQQLGYGENFIRTASRCSSPWIAFCDQDDIWLPNKLERCASIIDESTDDLRLVVHDALLLRDGGEPQRALMNLPAFKMHPRLSLPPRWFSVGMCQVFSRELLTRIPWHRRHMAWVDNPDAHDVWIPLLAAATGSVAWVGDTLALYRRHSSNQSPLDLSERAFDRAAYVESLIKVRAVSDTLLEIAGSTPDQTMADLLRQAGQQHGKFAYRLSNRLELYESRSFFGRVRRLARLILIGSYASGGCETFGKRALLADIRSLVWPASLPVWGPN